MPGWARKEQNMCCTYKFQTTEQILLNDDDGKFLQDQAGL